MNEENVTLETAEAEDKKGVRFANDFTPETKQRIRDEAAKRIDALLEKAEFSFNDLSQLSGVAHGSVKGRAKTLASAEAIVTAILNGERAAGGARKPSVDSIKSFLESLDPEARAKMLAELGITEA